MASSPYFGIIEEIWEVDFIKFKVLVFKRKWIDIKSGNKTHAVIDMFAERDLRSLVVAYQVS